MDLIEKLSPNYTAGRYGRNVIAIVDHITAGSMPGCLEWLCNPAAKASAHYLITRAGVIYQLVKNENTAWHAGVVSGCTWPLYDGTNPNRYTVGIEHECLGGASLTEAQYQASLWLHQKLIAAYGIIIDSDHITKHSNINSGHNCPGPTFPWTKLFADLNGSGTTNVSAAAITIVGGNTKITGEIINERSYGPMVAVCKAKGIAYSWDAAKRIMALAGANTDNIPANPTGVTIAVGDQAIAGQIINGSTWGPLAAVCRALNIPYSWDAKSRTMKF